MDPFTNFQSSNYWSSTTLAGDSGDAWFVFFEDGGVAGDNKTFSSHFVIAVRGGS
jgi:hypothetical protein